MKFQFWLKENRNDFFEILVSVNKNQIGELNLFLQKAIQIRTSNPLPLGPLTHVHTPYPILAQAVGVTVGRLAMMLVYRYFHRFFPPFFSPS